MADIHSPTAEFSRGKKKKKEEEERQDQSKFIFQVITENYNVTRMWANAERDGRPAEYRWRPLFNAAKFG